MKIFIFNASGLGWLSNYVIIASNKEEAIDLLKIQLDDTESVEDFIMSEKPIEKGLMSYVGYM